MQADDLYHVRETPLDVGSLIQPGRWGEIVLNRGKDHPFFFREHLLELWRLLRTDVQVSRLNCTFAHEGRSQAEDYAEPGEAILQVVPIDNSGPSARLDMLWVTWMGEPGATTEQIMGWCSNYWAGQLDRHNQAGRHSRVGVALPVPFGGDRIEPGMSGLGRASEPTGFPRGSPPIES